MKLLFKVLLIIFSAGVIAAAPFIKTNLIKNKPVYYKNTNKINDRECSFCHNDIIKYKVLHAPVTDDCRNCHESISEKHPQAKNIDFKLVEKTPDLCFICHEPKNDKKYVHSPVKNGDCKSCHSPHGTDNQYLLYKPSPTLVCEQCHDFDFKEKSNIHAPIELDGCLSCHDSHQSDHTYLLNEEKPALCITCHDNIGVEKQAKFQHAPFEDDCSNCHSPHNSKENFLLNESVPELCFTCHDDIQTILRESKHIHKVSEGKNDCNSCHSPHASGNNKILREEQTTLCLKCHNKTINTGTKTIENINAKLLTAKYKHPPLEEGCSVCHNPHGSENTSLLISSFPESEYVKSEVSNFELCFNCHDTELIEKEISETATNFRNGNENMHYLHINGDKGRNCNLCHDMHASKNKFLIKKRTKFGTWNMPLNFIPFETGGSCNTGCHTKKTYDRTSPIKYGYVPPQDSLSGTNSNVQKDTINNVKTVENIKDTIPDKQEFYADTDTNNIIDAKTDSSLKENITDKKDTVIINNEEKFYEADTKTTLYDTVNIKNPNVYYADTVKNIKDTVVDKNKNAEKEKSNETISDINKEKPDTAEVYDFKEEKIQNTEDKEKIQEIPVVISEKNKEIKKTETEAFEKIKNLKIYFEFGKTDFAKPAEYAVDKVYKFLKEYPESSIIICGYTDDIGSEKYNLGLSKKRAETVKKVLIAKGILPKRIKVKAYGETNPADTNETEKGRANNRRTEFQLK